MGAARNFSYVHPKYYDPHLPPPPQNRDAHHRRQNSHFFAAWGTQDGSLDPAKIYGRLLKPGQRPFVGARVPQALPPLWIILFHQVPFVGDDITLEIWDRDPHQAGATHLHSEPGVGIELPHHGPSITFPVSHTTLSNRSFPAWGDTDEVSDVSGTFSVDGTGAPNGSPLIQPSSSNLGWMLQFTADPGTYVLHVVNALGHAAVDQTDIMVP